MYNEKKFIKAIDEAIDILKDIYENYPKKAEYELTNCAYSVILDWYAEFSPTSYTRKFDLLNAFKVFKHKDGELWSVEFGPEFMQMGHHQDNEIIYNNSFIEGFHGGSRSDIHEVDVPLWRTPVPYYRFWADEAPQSFSPYERVFDEMQKISISLDKEIVQKAEKAINKAISYA